MAQITLGPSLTKMVGVGVSELLENTEAIVMMIVHFSYLKGAPDIRSTLEYLMTLFPRKLFNDTLPQIVLKHQLYSLHSDKTMVDKELVWLCIQG